MPRKKRTKQKISSAWEAVLSKPKRMGEPSEFKINTTHTGVLTIVILIGIMLFSASNFQGYLKNQKFIINEEPLEKVEKIKIKPGEIYGYTQKLGNETLVDLTFWIMQGQGCTIISLGGHGNDSYACISEWGVDKTGSNSTFSTSPYIVMFKPWMLAVNEGWKWNTSIVMELDRIKTNVLDANFTTIGKRKYRGRDAWVVVMKSSDSNRSTYFWIDEEKRVLLLENSTEYSIELVKGIKLN